MARDFKSTTVERGATVVETSFVLVLLLALILGIINLGRYMAIRAVLTRGAQEALNLAQKVDGIQVDVRNIDSTNSEYTRFTSSRNIVMSQAKRLPLSTLLTGVSSASAAALKSFEAIDSLKNGATFTTVEALLLRPGESAKYTRGGTTYWEDHPTLCSALSPTCTRPISASDSYDQILRQHPLKVELRAEVQLFYPFNFKGTVTGEALGYREQALTPTPPVQQPISNEMGTGLCSGEPNIPALTAQCEAQGLCFKGTKWSDNGCCATCPGASTTSSTTTTTQPWTCTQQQFDDCVANGGEPEPGIIQCCKRGSS